MALRFRGSAWFRQRIICATLSGRTVAIKDIRAKEEKPGLLDYEVSLLRMVEKITNGAKLEIDFTGTSVFYKPGIVVGGKIEHDCGTERGMGYFLEVLAALAPFGKDLLKATLKGVTNHGDNLDISVDTFQHVTIPNLRHFGVDEGVQFKVVKRGAAPNGGGIVVFSCPIVKVLSPIQLVDDGKIKKVRGVAYSVKASSTFSNRVIEAARDVLNPLASDIYIYADISHEKQAKDGSKQISPGYGLTLVAETTTGCYVSYEHMAQTAEIAEDVGVETANLFLLETIRRGCVDSTNQSLMLLLMAAGPDDVSKIRLGKLTEYTIEFLRHIKTFFGVTFKIEPDPETKTVLLTCLGAGFKNLSRKTF